MDRLSQTFAALADPTRRALLARLARGEASVGDLEMFPESTAARAACPKLMRAHAAMKARARWKETQS